MADMDRQKFKNLFFEMTDEANRLLQSERIPEDSIRLLYSVDLRYVKQYHEVNVGITRKDIEEGDIERIASRFHPEHNRLYGYSLEEQGTPIELINLRLQSVGKTVKPRFSLEEFEGTDPSRAVKNKRKVYLPMKETFVEIFVYDGHKMKCGNRVEGPAVIEQVNTTTFVTPEYNVVCDRYGSYTVFLKEREEEIRTKLGMSG
jgi:N-methylhydantoinase A